MQGKKEKVILIIFIFSGLVDFGHRKEFQTIRNENVSERATV
jgi:hypothetical protein